MVQKIVPFVLLFIFSFSLKAQLWVEKMKNPQENFYSIQQEFNSYWANKPYERGKGYKAFKRWEWFTEPRVYPSGNMQLASPIKAYEEYQKHLKTNQTNTLKINGQLAVASSSGSWTPVGPFGSPLGGDAGRITFVRFHPTNTNIIYAGTPAGGLWVTTDGGASWTTNTNSLSVIGCADLAINPTNTAVMYLATGDVENDNASIGVLKSIDGGLTWEPTGLTFTVNQQKTMDRLLINPLNPNILFAATSSGMYRTNNAGATWNLIMNGSFKDMEYRPNDTSTVYAVTTNGFLKTTTGGNTSSAWTSSQLIGGSFNRLCVSVTPADANYVYVLASKSSDNSFGGVYRSTNSGANFTQMSNSPNIFDWSEGGWGTGGQGWYDLACGVSPTNKNELVCGGVNTWRSLDGGTTWDLFTHWYGGGGAPNVHADVHAIEYRTGSEIFMGNDGGVYKTTNSGSSWTSLNAQMNIAQSYRIGQSATTANYIISGHQDNGTNLLNGSTWEEIYGGDGADCFVDWSNNNNLVASYVQGDYQRSSNGGASWTAISTGLAGVGAWVAPIIQSPQVATTYYCGYQQVYKSLNKGTSWTQMGTISGSGTILFLAAAPSNSMVLYAATNSAIYKTTNGGTTWTGISSGLPISSAAITRIAVDNTNANIIYVTFSGYSANNKVFTSTNGGVSWTNISAGLPNIPVNCVVHHKNTNGGIYVGTDVGVYYKDGTMSTFTPYMTGLPNTIVTDMEIFYPTNKLRASTYGRGVWESDLYIDPLAVPTAFFSTEKLPLCVNTSAQLLDQSSNIPTAWSWTLTGSSVSTSNQKNPTVTYNAIGIYTIELTATNSNGTSSVYTNTIEVVAPPTISLSSATICPAGNATLIANGATNYQWSSNATTSVTVVNPNTTTVYTCTGSIGACTDVKSTTVTVVPIQAPVITQTNAVGTTTSSANDYLWYLNSVPISSATAQSYTITEDGFYSLQITNSLGCKAFSNTLYVTLVGLEDIQLVEGLTVSPNPAKDFLNVKSLASQNKTINYSIYNAVGQLVKSGKLNLSSATTETIQLNNLSFGKYELKLNFGDKTKAISFIKE